MEDRRLQHGTRVGSDGTVLSHGGHIPAANAAAQRGVVVVVVVAMAGGGGGGCGVTVAATAALTTEARGGVPFAERPAAFITANQQIGGGAALHTGEG